MSFTEARKRAQAQANRRGVRMHVVRAGINLWVVNVSRPRGIGIKFWSVDPRV